jgi:hypothetical protein
MSTQDSNGHLSPPVTQCTPRFHGPWTRLSWSSAYATHPKEYFKAVQEENRRRDNTGWRRISRLKLLLKENPGIERCKGGSRYIRKQQNEKKTKKKGRPAAGTEEARSQTAAACEANRKRHADNRKKQEVRVKQEPE